MLDGRYQPEGAARGYWAEKLGKQVLAARQVSKRGGKVGCAMQGERVILSGTAVTVMETVITL